MVGARSFYGPGPMAKKILQRIFKLLWGRSYNLTRQSTENECVHQSVQSGKAMEKTFSFVFLFSHCSLFALHHFLLSHDSSSLPIGKIYFLLALIPTF
jgi:hypothetical protein